MRIAEPIETVGHFWLPGQSHPKMSGTLRVSKLGRVEVDLIGLFADSEEEVNNIFNFRQEDISRMSG